MPSLPLLLTLLDYAGVAVFAATGALAAARRGHDPVTFGFFAAVTGVGGGTLRDLLLGAPVFWINQPAYIAMTIAAALLIWTAGQKAAERGSALLWLDALGLAAYAVLGADKALLLGAPPLTAIVMGVLTAAFGGIIRDVLAHEPSVLLRREIYITAALAGAAVFVLLKLAGAPEILAPAAGFAVALALRAGALARGWSLPGWPGGKV